MKYIGISHTLAFAVALSSASSALCSPSDSESFSNKATQPSSLNSFEKQAFSIADVSEKAIPSVVNIATRKRVMARRRQSHPLFSDPFFRRFFEGAPNGRRQPPSRLERSLGSGVIVKKEGIVLTNNHVIEDADEVSITLSNDKEYKAEIIGKDPPSDLAVLKIIDPPKDLHAVSLGNSDTLRLGEVVIAIGNPFGVGQTVTMGIVSAKGRANVNIVDYEDFIQTDAAINPGNSGGALINMRGELVGINTAILSRSGGYQGIGFAIPSNMVESITSSLITNGKVTRGFLGISMQEFNSELAEAMGVKVNEGVLVSQVIGDTPADKAGLKPGDVITEIDGRKVLDSARFRNIVAAAGAGTKIKLNVVRKNQDKTINVTLAEKEDESLATVFGEDEGPLGGVKVESLSDEVRQKFDISNRITEGVVITELAQDSSLAEAGIRPGDVIESVNQQPVTSPSQFRSAYKKARKTLLLRVSRGGGSSFIVIQK